VCIQEFVQSVQDYTTKGKEEKLRFLFKIYDLDDDGFVQFDEMKTVLGACMEENGMQFSDEQIRKLRQRNLIIKLWDWQCLFLDDLTLAVFEDTGLDQDGSLSFDQLKSIFENHESLLENLSITYV